MWQTMIGGQSLLYGFTTYSLPYQSCGKIVAQKVVVLNYLNFNKLLRLGLKFVKIKSLRRKKIIQELSLRCRSSSKPIIKRRHASSFGWLLKVET